jgi:hypothetical protein
VIFHVVKVAVMKAAVFWDVAPCSLVGVYPRFRGAASIIALTMEAIFMPETSVNFYQTTRRNIPEDSHLQVLHLALKLKPDVSMTCSYEPTSGSFPCI